MENFLCGANVLVDMCSIFSEEFKFEKIGIITESDHFLNYFIKKIGQNNKIEIDKDKIKENSVKAVVFLGDYKLFNKINKQIKDKPVFFIFDRLDSVCKADYANANIVKVVHYPYILQDINKALCKALSYIFSFLGVCESIDFNSIIQKQEINSVKFKSSILNIVRYVNNNEINGATIDVLIKLILTFNTEKYLVLQTHTNLGQLVNLIYFEDKKNEYSYEFIMQYLISKLNLEFLIKANFAVIQTESFYNKFYFQKHKFPNMINKNELIASYYSSLKNSQIKNELILNYAEILNTFYKYFALNKLALRVYKKVLIKNKINIQQLSPKNFIKALDIGVDFSSFNLSVIMRNFGFFSNID